MPERSEALQRFLDCAGRAIRARAADGSPEAVAIEKIFAALAGSGGTLNALQPARLPVCSELPRGLAMARTGGQYVAALGEAIARLDPELAWQRRVSAKPEDEPFYSGHANAYVVGPGGLETRADVLVGISLMAPQVIYPDHDHPPEEVYVSLAAGQWRNAATSWIEPGPGGLFYNPPGIRHAMRTGSEPLLAVWCLWAG